MNCLHLPEGGYVGFRVPEGPGWPGDGALGLRFRAELSTKERLGGEFNYTVMLDGTTEIVIRSEEDLPTGQLLDFFVSRRISTPSMRMRSVSRWRNCPLSRRAPPIP